MLSSLDNNRTVRYAKTLLTPEIRRYIEREIEEAEEEHIQVGFQEVVNFLQNYLEGNTQIRLGALDQLKDKQYDMTADPKDFKRECERLFAVARIDNEGEMLRYLHDMLPDRLYAVMVGANPQTSNAFYEVLERY